MSSVAWPWSHVIVLSVAYRFANVLLCSPAVAAAAVAPQNNSLVRMDVDVAEEAMPATGLMADLIMDGLIGYSLNEAPCDRTKTFIPGRIVIRLRFWR